MKYSIWITVIIGVISLLTIRETVLSAPSGMYVRVCAIGQGDAILLKSPSAKVVLIDGGPNTDVLMDLGEVLPWYKRNIDLLVITHPDLDHITALPDVLERYTVNAVLMTGIVHNSGRYTELTSLLKRYNVPIITPEPNQVFDFGDGMILRTMWPHDSLFATESDEPNNTSVVVRAEYNDQSILLTGDIESATEAAIVASGQQLESTYLKVAHHGSTTSSSTGFLLAVKPAMAIISAGKDNKFNHPHEEILNRFTYFTIPIWNTAEQGDFEVLLR